MTGGGPRARFAIAALAAILAAGCSGEFAGWMRERMAAATTSAVLFGKLRNATGDALTIVVVTFREKDGKLHAEDATHAFGGKTYALSVRRREPYRIVAFADRNGNFHRDPGEPVAVSAIDPERQPSRPLLRRDLDLRKDAPVPEDIAAALETIGPLEHRPAHLAAGTVVNIDDDRLSRGNGNLGLWSADRFLETVGAGVFFLQPFDARKTPVLFLSGAAGFAAQWGPLIAGLDRSRYQPWIFLYPSGARLDSSVRLLSESFARLHESYRFGNVDVVAHSMGGLVAREWILREKDAHGTAGVGNFISISTPWRGHETAALGADRGGSPIASWVDLRTDSEFQNALFARRLPAEVRYWLLYSHGGKKLPLLPDNDGTVTVQSQLRRAAKEEAVAVRGFDKGHAEILASPEVVRVVATILDGGDIRSVPTRERPLE